MHFCLSTLVLLREMKHHELVFRDHKLSEGHLPNVGQVLKIGVLTMNSAFPHRKESCMQRQTRTRVSEQLSRAVASTTATYLSCGMTN